MRALSLAEIARCLRGEVRANRVRFAPPGHSRRDRSAWVEMASSLPDGFYVGTFSGDDPLRIKDFVRERLGLAGQSRAAPVQNSGSLPCEGSDRAGAALKIWHEAGQPWATPVQAYLTSARPRGRAVSLPHRAAGEAIRFHPSCPFAGTRTPAMVCLVRDVITNEPKAIHRTALRDDGSMVKIRGYNRLSLGPVAGGAVKLTPDEDVSACLGVGEGIESSLSLLSIPEFGSSPVWSLVSAGGIERLPVLKGVESLWIAVDHDTAGLKAARAAALRWQAAGAEAFLIKPSQARADLNDLLVQVNHAEP